MDIWIMKYKCAKKDCKIFNCIQFITMLSNFIPCKVKRLDSQIIKHCQVNQLYNMGICQEGGDGYKMGYTMQLHNGDTM